MTAPHHLVTVWNRSYASDAMDEHLAVLIDWAGRAQAGDADGDEVYVWWGNIRSPNRKGLLPHADAVTALDEQVRVGEGRYEILGIRCEGIVVRLGRARMSS